MSDSSPASRASGRALYVYYKVPAGHCAEAEARVRALQASLMAEWPGLSARLLARADQAQVAEPTWMEIYEHPDGVSAMCETRLAELVSGLPAGLIGPRHTEVFRELPCAAS